MGTFATHKFPRASPGNSAGAPASATRFQPDITAPPLKTGRSPLAASKTVGAFSVPASSGLNRSVSSSAYTPPFKIIFTPAVVAGETQAFPRIGFERLEHLRAHDAEHTIGAGMPSTVERLVIEGRRA